MTLSLTNRANSLINQTSIGQQLIVEIDGIPLIFSAVEATRFWRIGDDDVKIGDPGLAIGGQIPISNGRQFISLNGTTKRLTQQLEIDKGGTGSIQRFNVELVDKNQEVTRAFKPGNYVEDILSREATVYVAVQGGSHPEDSVRIFNGVVDSTEAKQGSWRIGIAHPESSKRQDVFIKQSKVIPLAIDGVTTNIDLTDTDGFIEADDVSVFSYIRVDDEVIRFTGTSGTTLLNVARGQFGTAAVAHDSEADAETIYRLVGTPINLALKMMLSGSGAYAENIEARRFNKVTPSLTVQGGIFFANELLQDELGLSVGDKITTAGSIIPANNITDSTIKAFQVSGGGTIVITDDNFTIETDSDAVASFKSQFDTLPVGAGFGMNPKQVDVAQHLFLEATFSSNASIPMDFFMKDTIDGKEFITTELYFPAGFYQVPRKGRASAQITAPPLVLSELKELNSDSVINADKLSLKRSTRKDFFNAVTYSFNEDVIEEKFLAGEVVLSTRSSNRINVGVKALNIESRGLRDDAPTRNFLKNQARRFSDRYQFATESVEVETNYKTGFNIEVADTVLFGDAALQLVDQGEGNRNFIPRLMEVVNKSLDVTGKQPVKLSLLDTGFGLDGRFGTVAPSSLIGAGSTTTTIVIKNSFNFQGLEREKYLNFINEEVIIRSQDFTFSETVTLKQLSPTQLDRLTIDPPLSIPPPEDYVLELTDYDPGIDAALNSKEKAIHTFFNPQVEVVSGIDGFNFTVSPSDALKFNIDGFVRVHNFDFTDDSVGGTIDDDLEVTDVDLGANTITVNRDIGFTPAAGYFVELIGFKDGGLPYRLI